MECLRAEKDMCSTSIEKEVKMLIVDYKCKHKGLTCREKCLSNS